MGLLDVPEGDGDVGQRAKTSQPRPSPTLYYIGTPTAFLRFFADFRAFFFFAGAFFFAFFAMRSPCRRHAHARAGAP